MLLLFLLLLLLLLFVAGVADAVVAGVVNDD